MMSSFSKIVTFIGISSFAIYITFLQHQFSIWELLEKKEGVADFSQTEVLLKKEDLPKLTKEHEEQPSPLSSQVIQESSTTPIKEQEVIIPKVPEGKMGVYETLEVHHTDIEDESYRPAISPCITPMGYKVGRFDPQFNLSREKFFQITREAIAVWEEAAGTSLFTHDPTSGTLTLNLIYDERQATTISLGYLALEIENTKLAAENTRTAYEQEKTSYLNDSETFNKEALGFQQKYSNYNERVTTYNDRGGATKEEYDAMMLELDSLKKEADQFETRRVELTKRMEAINAKVKRYNELVNYVNGLIRKSNSIGSRTFTEGRFVPSTNTIDIYQYSDETKLKRVLIHEFGHALGIGHVKNVQSIMYSFNSGTTTSLSVEDKAALEASCKKR